MEQKLKNLTPSFLTWISLYKKNYKTIKNQVFKLTPPPLLLGQFPYWRSFLRLPFLECSGGEDSIFDCQHDSDCDRFALASGVKCFPIVPWCSSLLFENKIICSNEYDYVNSQVICRHSGYGQGKYVNRSGHSILHSSAHPNQWYASRRDSNLP